MRFLQSEDKPDKDSTKERKLEAYFIHEHRYKCPKQNISKPDPAILKEIIYHDQVGFTPGM